jgi:hypothetical protein
MISFSLSLPSAFPQLFLCRAPTVLIVLFIPIVPRESLKVLVIAFDRIMRLAAGHVLSVRRTPILVLVVLVLLWRAEADAVSLPVVTIASDAAFQQQRVCVQNIVGNVGNVLGCPDNGGFLLSCWCRADLEPLAYSYISAAIPSSCSNPPDLTSAISLYSSYCQISGSITPYTSYGESASVISLFARGLR